MHYLKETGPYLKRLLRGKRCSKCAMLKLKTVRYVTQVCYTSHRKFIQMSYKFFGCGPNSRNAQYVVHQCVSILYAFRCAFIVHCIDYVDHTKVDVPEQLSSAFFNSAVNSSFTAIQNIKRPAKQCIPDHYGQNVTWTGTGFKALQVHTGSGGLGRVAVSHSIIKETFAKIFDAIVKILSTMNVSVYSKTEFDGLLDSLTSSSPGQGLITYNPLCPWAEAIIDDNPTVNDFQRNFVVNSTNLYRLCIAAMHLSGGPSPRGTEEAVTRLTNSGTELMRNVYIIDGTIGVRSG